MTAGTHRRAFLLEIGTEEIPARMAGGAIEALRAGLLEALGKAGLDPSGARGFGTPRRLAVLVEGLIERQPDETVEVTGPPAAVAFDAAGSPTRAAQGFARAQGVAVESLLRVRTPKGECVAARRVVAGKSASEVLAEQVPAVVGALSFPKTMRWGTGEHRFVRPVHSVVALLDDEVIPLSITGIGAGRDTFGHRVAGARRIPLARATDYLDALRSQGVLADPNERKAAVAGQLEAAALQAGGRMAAPPGASVKNGDPELLDEVTHLVEWPAVLTGSFEAAFLQLPAEILMTSMRHHQKYFALRGPDGALLSRFLSVANVRADRDGAIRRGNEWVLRARLSDARFFFEEDRKGPLEAFGAGLDRVAFHEKLGSYEAKRRRIARLGEKIAPAFSAAGRSVDAAAAQRAALLCKNDLTTQMVKEFPELEGIVGGLYARADHLPDPVAGAIADHYLPRSLEDPIPSTAEGAVVSLADRLDSQAGIFLLGLVPTGSRDPYALRRSVQGACRILLETGVGLSLQTTLLEALRGYDRSRIEGAVPEEEALGALLQFYAGRQEYLGTEAGVRADSARAALAASSDDPSDARARMTALDTVRNTPGFDDLAVSHKRIKNILKDRSETMPFHPDRLHDEAERVLGGRLEAARPEIESARRRRDPGAALRSIAALRDPLDRFFQEVMVLAEDRSLRDNRVALLQQIAALFMAVADFSELGASPAAAHKEV